MLYFTNISERVKEMTKNYKYKKATIADIDELVKARIIVLRVANKLSNDVDMSLVEKES